MKLPSNRILSNRAVPFPTGDVKREVCRLFALHGQPAFLHSDNGNEFIVGAVRELLTEQGVHTHYIESGKLWQNGYNESSNSIFRDNCLDKWQFRSIRGVTLNLRQCVEEYNPYRHYGVLDRLTPRLFRIKWERLSGKRRKIRIVKFIII